MWFIRFLIEPSKCNKYIYLLFILYQAQKLRKRTWKELKGRLNIAKNKAHDNYLGTSLEKKAYNRICVYLQKILPRNIKIKSKLKAYIANEYKRQRDGEQVRPKQAGAAD